MNSRLPVKLCFARHIAKNSDDWWDNTRMRVYQKWSTAFSTRVSCYFRVFILLFVYSISYPWRFVNLCFLLCVSLFHAFVLIVCTHCAILCIK